MSMGARSGRQRFQPLLALSTLGIALGIALCAATVVTCAVVLGKGWSYLGWSGPRPLYGVELSSGDVNGDGAPDILIVAYVYSPGALGTRHQFFAGVMSTRSGEWLHRFASWGRRPGHSAPDGFLGVGGGCVLDDLDGDGWAEVAILSARMVDLQRYEYQRKVHVFNGIDFRHLYDAAVGGSASSLDGHNGPSIIAISDVDHDGFRDIAVVGGELVLMSGQDGHRIVSSLIPGEAGGDPLDVARIALAGDVNGDGARDLIVAGAQSSILSGADCTLLSSIPTPSNIAGAGGDLDGDGIEDFLLATEGGIVAYSGRGADLICVFPVASEGLLEPHMTIVGDCDGDGFDEVLTTTAQLDRLFVYSGSAGRVLYEVPGDIWRWSGLSDGRGGYRSVLAIGDADGDGRADYAAGVGGPGFPGTVAGCSLRVYSGRSGDVVLNVDLGVEE